MNNLKKVVLIITVLLIMLSKASYANDIDYINYTFKLSELGNFFSTNSMSKIAEIRNKKIEPGSSGFFDISIDSKKYFSDINFSLKFLNLKNKPNNLYFIIDNKIVYDIENHDPIEGFCNKNTINTIKRVYWKWDYEQEEKFDDSREDFTFDMELIVERKEQNTIGKKLPRTGYDITFGILLAIIIAIIICTITTKVEKENNRINKKYQKNKYT